MSINICGDCGATYPSGIEHTCPSTIRLEADPFVSASERIAPYTQAEVDNLRDVQGYPPEADPWAGADAVMDEARRVTSGQRGSDYDTPEDNFARIALVFNGLLDEKLRVRGSITEGDIARLMCGVKLVRDSHKPKRDNRVDLHGYGRSLERVEPTDD